ncbi:MAG: hypothetical protein L3J39_15105 [Verrucomicrobiales bacterium]|nr:hypothetical protein [Verrucomicrobiales bacterium]
MEKIFLRMSASGTSLRTRSICWIPEHWAGYFAASAAAGSLPETLAASPLAFPSRVEGRLTGEPAGSNTVLLMPRVP